MSRVELLYGSTLSSANGVEPIAKASAEDIDALAAKLEPALARAVRDYLQGQVDAVSLDALEAAIKKGDNAAVQAMVSNRDPTRAAAITDKVQDAVWHGGALAAKGAPVLREAQFVFGRLNPALVRWLQTYDLDLIKRIDKGATEFVRAELIRGMREGRNPIDQARAIKQAVGLTERQAQAVASYRKSLETFHLRRSAKRWGLGNEVTRQSGTQVYRTDAKGKPVDGIEERRLRDFRYDRTLARAMATQKPLTTAQIDAQVAAYQRKYIQRRAQTIARTESLRATNVGVQEAWRQAIAEGKVDGALVRKKWIVAAGCCKVCASIPGANPKRGVRLDGTFAVPDRESIKLPPQHPDCRCTVFIRTYVAEQLLEAA